MLGMIELHIEYKLPIGAGGPFHRAPLDQLITYGGLLFMVWAPLYMVACPEEWLRKRLLPLDDNAGARRRFIQHLGYAIFIFEVIFFIYWIFNKYSRLQALKLP